MRIGFLIVTLLVIMQPCAFGQLTNSQTQNGDQKFEGFNLQGYDNEGQKAWDVKGDTANIVGTEVELQNVNANAYGEQKVNVTAESGSIDQVNGNMKLRKDVVITSERGTQMLTDSLDWDKQKDLVSTEDKVLITDEQMTAKGTGMEAHPNLKTAQLKEDVTVMVDTEPDPALSKLLTVTCDGPMTIDQAKSIAILENNVVAIQDDRTLKTDRAEIYFDPKTNQIQQMICIGNVVIIQGENKTYADKATYNALDQKVILSGRPKLIMLTEGENALTSFGN